ncbi:MAG TPA: glycosyltransferase [Candidatus Sulfotelmatobacter sp.]|nr:glycosyltransferase [Candidatus Sulfotelmatobacter sp.]
MSYAPIRSEITRNHQEYTHLETTVLSPKSSKPSTRLRRKRSLSARPPKKGVVSDYPIIVHSHLCWDWVWQRPQQFISRLSRRHKILFVETVAPDPELATGLARFRKPPELPNLTLLRLQFPAWRWSDGEYVDRERRRLVREFLAGPGAGEFEDPVQWFYDPMAVTAFAGHMEEILTVYDCMDELSKFRFAPPEILRRELELLARAEVVFTGGRKLFENKSQFHDNCHFYGCGVDDAHFGQARTPGTAAHADLAGIPKPILGYFGVIDERMDYGLIAALADANPKWSVVMVGPVTKVDPKLLPQRANLHWLGQRAYAELPALCKGFDLCLMPFALNEATEFINPTKALEYMATARPIVSTAVTDVVRNFGAVVKIAESAADFVARCQQALDQPDQGAIQRGLELVGENSWESIVARLEEHIQEALLAKRSTGVSA